MAIITINLAPVEEIENNLWWLPDATIFIFAAAIAWSITNYQISTIEEEIQKREETTNNYKSAYNDIAADIRKVANLEEKISDLQRTHQSIERVTSSLLAKYLPIILMEHIQVLRPEGVWLTSFSFDQTIKKAQNNNNQSSDITDLRTPLVIEGQALSNTILSEFMTLLKDTKNQEHDLNDKRTQAFFDLVEIDHSTLEKPGPSVTPRTRNTANSSQIETEQTPVARPDVTKFRIYLTFKEKSMTPAINKRISQYLRKRKIR